MKNFSQKIQKIECLIEIIKRTNLDNVFNPYTSNCNQHDHSSSHIIRENNLRIYLTKQLQLDPKIIWLGRDLGYRGGRRTGIPLTDEVHLKELNSVLNGTKIKKATETAEMKEMTARAIWKLTKSFRNPPFFWNVFPFHPHDKRDSMSNRSHSKTELKATKEILEAILDIYDFEHHFALGRDAAKILDEMKLSPVYVRHPSYGGEPQFNRTIIEETPKAYASF